MTFMVWCFEHVFQWIIPSVESLYYLIYTTNKSFYVSRYWLTELQSYILLTHIETNRKSLYGYPMNVYALPLPLHQSSTLQQYAVCIVKMHNVFLRNLFLCILYISSKGRWRYLLEMSRQVITKELIN